MRYVAVLPYVDKVFRERCLRRCRLDHLLEVDNTATNVGVMRSHNFGIDLMRDLDADWLIVLSAALRFGRAGGLDFIAELESAGEARVVNAVGVFGWHLIAFSRATIEETGRWDENFTPYGFDDNDYAIRIRKVQPSDAYWQGVRVDVTDTIMGHSLKLAGVRSDAHAQLEYFERKWGARPGRPFEEYLDEPFGPQSGSVAYWPAPSSPPVPPESLAAVADGRWNEPPRRHPWKR